MGRQAEARELLAKNGIQYAVRRINRKSPPPFAAGTRARTGTFGENLQLECQYIIHVHKSDYDRAAAIIR